MCQLRFIGLAIYFILNLFSDIITLNKSYQKSFKTDFGVETPPNCPAESNLFALTVMC